MLGGQGAPKILWHGDCRHNVISLQEATDVQEGMVSSCIGMGLQQAQGSAAIVEHGISRKNAAMQSLTGWRLPDNQIFS